MIPPARALVVAATGPAKRLRGLSAFACMAVLATMVVAGLGACDPTSPISVQSGYVPNFTPSRNGFHFSNSFPSEPDITIPLPTGGSIGLGDASTGLCGGMVFAARDLYEAGLTPPATTDAPADGSPQFNYIVSRLFDSFNGPLGVINYLEWMNIPDHDTVLGPPGLASRTINVEWPKIKSDIDGGHPSPLGLILVKSTDPTMLGHNHQVLAYGYELDTLAKNLVLHTYDPNVPDQDTMLSLNIGDPTHTTPITDSAGDTVHGFFRTGYDFTYPAPFAPLPPPPTATPVPSPSPAAADCGSLTPITLPVSGGDMTLSSFDNSDKLHVDVQYNLTNGWITFVLVTAPQVTWWKGIEVQDENGSILGSDYTQDANHGPVSTTIDAYQHYPSLRVVLLKAKTFGVHTGMYCVSNVQDLVGATVTVTWETD